MRHGSRLILAASSGAPRLISDGFASDPIWAPDGRELFYVTPDAAMVVPVETGDTFQQRGSPRRLFSMDPYYVGAYFNWDVSPDGQQFLMIRRSEDTGSDSASGDIVVVVSWFEELTRLVPTN